MDHALQGSFKISTQEKIFDWVNSRMKKNNKNKRGRYGILIRSEKDKEVVVVVVGSYTLWFVEA